MRSLLLLLVVGQWGNTCIPIPIVTGMVFMWVWGCVVMLRLRLGLKAGSLAWLGFTNLQAEPK